MRSCSLNSLAGQEDTNILFLWESVRLHRRSFDEIMEIYVSRNCKFLLLATIIVGSTYGTFSPYFAWKHRYMDMMNVTFLINYCFYTCFFYANRYDRSFHQNMVNEIRYIQLIDLLTLESRLLDGLYEDKLLS